MRCTHRCLAALLIADPPDGHEYLEVVFERCDEPGGIHQTLLPLAICTFFAYTIGYPLVLSIVLVAFALVFLILRPPSKSGASAVVVDYYQLTNIISVPATSACSTSLCPLVSHA